MHSGAISQVSKYTAPNPRGGEKFFIFSTCKLQFSNEVEHNRSARCDINCLGVLRAGVGGCVGHDEDDVGVVGRE